MKKTVLTVMVAVLMTALVMGLLAPSAGARTRGEGLSNCPHADVTGPHTVFVAIAWDGTGDAKKLARLTVDTTECNFLTGCCEMFRVTFFDPEFNPIVSIAVYPGREIDWQKPALRKLGIWHLTFYADGERELGVCDEPVADWVVRERSPDQPGIVTGDDKVYGACGNDAPPL